MKKLFRKFKNIHFLILTGIICFYSFYSPVGYFTTYANHLPYWTLPLFIFGAFVPLWANELFWRTSKLGSDAYIMFHDLHFEDREWKKRRMNLSIFFRVFGKWCLRSKEFILMSILNIGALIYGFMDILYEVVFPFAPFYFTNALWWISLIKLYTAFRAAVRDGEIRYGDNNTATKTHFSQEWYQEMKKIRAHEEELRKRKKEL